MTDPLVEIIRGPHGPNGDAYVGQNMAEEIARKVRAQGEVTSTLPEREEVEREDTDECPAILWHGPGHQSQTPCERRGPHDVHRCLYITEGGRVEATWRDGQYIASLREKGYDIPSYVNEGTMMTGFFNEPPQEDE